MERRYRFQMTIYIVGQKQRASDFFALVTDHTLTHEVRRMKVQRPLSYPCHIVSERMYSNTPRKQIGSWLFLTNDVDVV